MMLMAEGIFLLLYAGTLLGPFLWIALGLATYTANTHSKGSAGEDVAGVAPVAPPVTRFARSAKIVTFAVAGLPFLIASLAAVSFFGRIDGPFGEFLGYAGIAMYVVQFALVLALAALLIAVLWDVRLRHKRAGRDAGIAYAVIAALHVVQLGVFIALIVSGGQML